MQNDPQQLRFWALREFWAHAFECISLGMPFQYPPRPENRACQGPSATVKYSRQLVLVSFILFLTSLYTSGFRGRWPAKTTTGSLETLENPPTGKLLKEKKTLSSPRRGESRGPPTSWTNYLGSPRGRTAGRTAARATDFLG